MSQMELRSRLSTEALLRSYRRQSFAWENPIPNFDDVYDDVLETIFLYDQEHYGQSQGALQRILVCNALMECGMSFVLDQQVCNVPMKAVW